MANEYDTFEFLEDQCATKILRKENRRHLREEWNPFSLENSEFTKRYRLTKELAQNLCHELRPFLNVPKKSTDLSIETKVLTALSFYATGSNQRPVGNMEVHSMAQQKIYDANMQIISVDASHGGANYDSFIWAQHTINLEIKWLLGDSGYPLRRTLMTPFLNATPETPEAYYTNLHMRARNCFERTIGLLKARLRCLMVHRVLHYSPEVASLIVNACLILHNICNKANAPVDQLSDAEVNQEAHSQLVNTEVQQVSTTNIGLGYTARNALIQQLWERRHITRD